MGGGAQPHSEAGEWGQGTRGAQRIKGAACARAELPCKDILCYHQRKTCFQGEREASGCRSGWKSDLSSSHGNLNTVGGVCSPKPTFARPKRKTAFTRTAHILTPQRACSSRDLLDLMAISCRAPLTAQPPTTALKHPDTLGSAHLSSTSPPPVCPTLNRPAGFLAVPPVWLALSCLRTLALAFPPKLVVAHMSPSASQSA